MLGGVVVSRKRKFNATHARRASIRETRFKAWAEPVTAPGRAFANTEGDRGDNNPRGTYYEAVIWLTSFPASYLYKCTRVFTRERLLPLVIGAEPLEAAQTAVWLGTNKAP